MIDAHQHFWNYSPSEYAWISESMPALRRDFLPSDLQKEQQALGFQGSIAVQARQSLSETEWLLKLADSDSRILGVVGWVDLCSPKLSDQLDHFVINPKFKGVRHIVQDEPDEHFMLRPDFLRGLGLLEFANLTYDLLVFPRQIPAAIEIAKRFPKLRLVLDHIGKPPIKSGALSGWAGQIAELARCPNVMCKISGMVTEADHLNWKPQDMGPYLEVIVRAFGFERLMFGSDWPVCRLAASYEQVFCVAKNYFSKGPQSELDGIFGLNSKFFYNL